MKKIFLALILAFTTLCSAGITTSAYNNNYVNEISPYYLYTYQAKSTLEISGKSATCKSSLTGMTSVTKISATQYLEKKNGTKWETISGGTWSDSVNSSSLTMSNSKSNLSSGTYRLRTVFTVYCGNNYETVEKVSSEATV